MFCSNDNKVHVEVVKDYSTLTLPAADFSIWTCPTTLEQFTHLMKAIAVSPTQNHTALIICRGKVNDLIEQLSFWKTIKNIQQLEIYETVSITYGSSSLRNGVGFMKLGDFAVVITKGRKPNFAQTSWFRPDKSNASNVWDTTPYGSPDAYESSCHQDNLREPITMTWLGKFCWDIGYLVASLATPLQYKSLLTNFSPVDISLMSFVKNLGFMMTAYSDSQVTAEAAIEMYNGYKIKE